MISSLLAQAWTAPTIDWHAIAPELVLIAGINLVLLIDLWLDESKKWAMATLTGFVMLGAVIPVVTLAVLGGDVRDAIFDGRYVVDEYALILKALFLLVGYVVVLLSQNELEEGGYYQGEFYVLMLVSVLGMVMMASSRDLLSVFVALELLSIPAYMMAAWRKRDVKSNEAGVKYYLLGVFASGVLLYGMSFLYGTTGSTKLTEIGAALSGDLTGMQVLAVVFVVAGFAFKISAVPFHTWAPDTYEGAPTPVTAFLSVASKSAGFVALLTVLYLGLYGADEVHGPFIWVMAALTMTVGNMVALRQTNIVRMLAYSSVSQGGFILMPLAVMGTGAAESSLRAVVIYLLIYAFSNLGAFAVIIAVARKTRSGEISSFGGLITYAPGLGVLMTIFLASLAGIPPLGIWIAKLQAFKALIDAGSSSAYVLAIIAAVNTVIAAGYYMRVLR
ncbi:MAG: NADH-quinone oxidoreductase subunit N, partial [Ilumatobacteraceae bacterium]